MSFYNENMRVIFLLMLSAFLCSCASIDKTPAFSGALKEGDGSARKAVAVYIEVVPSQREEFLKIMKEVLEASQKEEGCLEYTLWADLYSPNVFFLYEEYKDMNAFMEHQNSAHFKKFDAARKAMSGLVMRGKHINVASAEQKRPKVFKPDSCNQ